jgi:CheY-like chemotaxis protein
MPAGLAGVRVLVVDDVADARDLLALMLSLHGAFAVVAGSAEEALEALRRERPDVLVSDISMPGADGYELISRVRQLSPEEGGQTPAVAVTAHAAPEDRLAALRAGFQEHVAKPVNWEQLVQNVARLAGRE